MPTIVIYRKFCPYWFADKGTRMEVIMMDHVDSSSNNNSNGTRIRKKQKHRYLLPSFGAKILIMLSRWGHACPATKGAAITAFSVFVVFTNSSTGIGRRCNATGSKGEDNAGLPLVWTLFCKLM
jgi:hypothetical protein